VLTARMPPVSRVVWAWAARSPVFPRNVSVRQLAQATLVPERGAGNSQQPGTGMQTNEEPKQSREALLESIEGYVRFFKRNGFMEAEGIGLQVYKWRKHPQLEDNGILKQVLLRLCTASSCHHHGPVATKSRLNRIRYEMRQAYLKAKEAAKPRAEEDEEDTQKVELPTEEPPPSASWWPPKSKTPTRKYGELYPLGRGSHGGMSGSLLNCYATGDVEARYTVAGALSLRGAFQKAPDFVEENPPHIGLAAAQHLRTVFLRPPEMLHNVFHGNVVLLA